MKEIQKLLPVIVLFSFIAVLHPQEKSICGDSETSLQQRGAMAYHGKRMQPKFSDFYIVEISAQALKSGFFSITIVFNAPLDPRTITQSSVTVNGESLPAKSRIAYNREGTAMRIKIPQNKKQLYSVSLAGLCSFNGTMLKDQYCADITDGYQMYFERN